MILRLLSRFHNDLTVVGIGLETSSKIEVIQLIQNDLYEQNILKYLDGVDELYSYNGSRFDLPFIEVKLLVDLKQCIPHRDLMYDCWRNNLKGGLKAVECKLGIDRKLQGINGYMAVKLWWDYVNNDNKDSLKMLLDYNAEDVLNLRVLREKLNIE